MLFIHPILFCIFTSRYTYIYQTFLMIQLFLKLFEVNISTLNNFKNRIIIICFNIVSNSKI